MLHFTIQQSVLQLETDVLVLEVQNRHKQLWDTLNKLPKTEGVKLALEKITHLVVLVRGQSLPLQLKDVTLLGCDYWITVWNFKQLYINQLLQRPIKDIMSCLCQSDSLFNVVFCDHDAYLQTCSYVLNKIKCSLSLFLTCKEISSPLHSLSEKVTKYLVYLMLCPIKGTS